MTISVYSAPHPALTSSQIFFSWLCLGSSSRLSSISSTGTYLAWSFCCCLTTAIYSSSPCAQSPLSPPYSPIHKTNQKKSVYRTIFGLQCGTPFTSVCVFITFFVHMYIYIYMFIYKFISICTSVCLCFSGSVSLFVCPSVQVLVPPLNLMCSLVCQYVRPHIGFKDLVGSLVRSYTG